MPVPAIQLELDQRVSILLLGIAFSFVLRRQPDLPARLSPATRMQQIHGLVKQMPAMLASLTKHRRELLLELGSLLRKGPERYLSSALRELQVLSS